MQAFPLLDEGEKDRRGKQHESGQMQYPEADTSHDQARDYC